MYKNDTMNILHNKIGRPLVNRNRIYADSNDNDFMLDIKELSKDRLNFFVVGVDFRYSYHVQLQSITQCFCIAPDLSG